MTPLQELLFSPAQRYAPLVDDIRKRLIEVLTEFHIFGEVCDAKSSGAEVRFDYQLAPGVKARRAVALADDIAGFMSVTQGRIAAGDLGRLSIAVLPTGYFVSASGLSHGAVSASDRGVLAGSAWRL